MKMTPSKSANVFHFKTHDPELDRLLNPSSAYSSPQAVLRDPALKLSEKKAILASWASDACAIESKPAWRKPPGVSQPVSFDEIMASLQELDRTAGNERRGLNRVRTDNNQAPPAS